jgi:hypothetical protein
VGTFIDWSKTVPTFAFAIESIGYALPLTNDVEM